MNEEPDDERGWHSFDHQMSAHGTPEDAFRVFKSFSGDYCVSHKDDAPIEADVPDTPSGGKRPASPPGDYVPDEGDPPLPKLPRLPGKEETERPIPTAPRQAPTFPSDSGIYEPEVPGDMASEETDAAGGDLGPTTAGPGHHDTGDGSCAGEKLFSKSFTHYINTTTNKGINKVGDKFMLQHGLTNIPYNFIKAAMTPIHTLITYVPFALMFPLQLINYFSNIQPTFVQKVPRTTIPMSDQPSKVSQQASHGVIDTDTTIAMMRDCQLAWEQLRKIRRYL